MPRRREQVLNASPSKATTDGMSDPTLSTKKRRLELPLKKRYYQQDNSSSNSDLTLNSQSEDAAGENGSAIIDYSLPTRSRALEKRGDSCPGSSSICGNHTDQSSDTGFESSSSSIRSCASSSEEPLDLSNEKFTPEHHFQRACQQQQMLASLFPYSLLAGFNENFLLLQRQLQESELRDSLPRPSVSGPSASPPTASKRSRSTKQKPQLMQQQQLHLRQEEEILNQQPSNLQQEEEENSLLRRNYKNMTVERRMEANARERTRVHTIGSAFDRLRKLIPSLATDQKLSKLSILRISCGYIMLLGAMNGVDYSVDQRGYSVQDCIEMLTDTINTESKFKRVA